MHSIFESNITIVFLNTYLLKAIEVIVGIKSAKFLRIHTMITWQTLRNSDVVDIVTSRLLLVLLLLLFIRLLVGLDYSDS